jgi:putative ABC transport system ATP-binding protein
VTEASPGVLFELEDVSVVVGERRILDRVDLVVPGGCLAVLGGPSGAGKTSLLRLLNRLDVPSRGSVGLRGVDLATIDPVSLRRDVSMVFQQPPLFPGTVADNLRVADAAISDSAIIEALSGVGLPVGCAEQEAGTLSVGEAQRLCFARALRTEPTVVLADEPTSALDTGPKRGLEELSRGLVESGISVVWVSHEAGQIRRIADHLIVLDQGRVAAQGSTSELMEDPSPVVRAVLAPGP